MARQILARLSLIGNLLGLGLMSHGTNYMCDGFLSVVFLWPFHWVLGQPASSFRFLGFVLSSYILVLIASVGLTMKYLQQIPSPTKFW